MRTLDELKKISMDIVDGKIFVSTMAETEVIPSIFMPLIFLSEEQVKDIHILFEYYSNAGPCGINGYPIFMQCQKLSFEEVEKMNVFIREYEKMKKDFLQK